MHGRHMNFRKLMVILAAVAWLAAICIVGEIIWDLWG